MLQAIRLVAYTVSGYFMHLDSTHGQFGDKATLLSPRTPFRARSSLKFSYHMMLNESDTLGALSVYRYTQLHTYDLLLFDVRGSQGQAWSTSVSICIPSGTYQLAFVGTVGFPSASDIAVDDVEVTLDINCEDWDTLSSAGTAICTLTVMILITRKQAVRRRGSRRCKRCLYGTSRAADRRTQPQTLPDNKGRL